MQRKTIWAVAGVTLACAAAVSSTLIAQSTALTSLDLRWLQSSEAPAARKADRLPVRMPGEANPVMSFDLSAHSMTVVTKLPARPIVESAVQTPRPVSVRSIPVQPVRDISDDQEVKKERLPTGCEPAFSPVTNPDFAHIGVRCDS